MAILPELTPPNDAPTQPSNESHFFNRELSWLEFNRRVLDEALEQQHPLLERVKFLSIFSTNLDEFFMIRVAGMKQQVAAHVTALTIDGMTPAEQLSAIRRVVSEHLTIQRNCWLDDLKPKLQEQGIHVLDYENLNEEQREFCKNHFEQNIFPVLTPLAFDMSHPFPHISNLSINLAVVINDPEEGERFARVKVPAVLPRLIPIPLGDDAQSNQIPPERRRCFVWLDQVIAEHIGSLFPGHEVVETHAFRIIRNADMEIQEEEAADLLRTIQQSVRQRRFGASVRISVEQNMPKRIRDLLLANLKLTPNDLYEVRGPLGLADLMQLTQIDRPDLKDAPFYPQVPTVLRYARTSAELFAAIRQQDILLHHPYDSFQPLVEMIEAAAEDRDVLAIKQTLYRVGSNSPIVKALMHAREQDKQVTVLVELKARFDEENNITWARALERAGVHVVYGLVGLKTHAKLALVVRRESDGIRRYVHLGTGNYNATTARIYTDLGLLTCRPEIGADASDLFNFLTGYSRQREYRRLLVAPVSLRQGLERLIRREIVHAQQGRLAHLVFKFNALVDPSMIELLYLASQAGVKIDLIVRGICCLRPGVPGLSENISVRSIVGRFLEHSRVYSFANGGNLEVYLGSADLMQRNLDRRVETLFPIEDAAMAAHIRNDLLEAYLQDTARARILQPDGSYVRARPNDGAAPFDCQANFAFGHYAPLD
jgi:polyphosphate kinase